MAKTKQTPRKAKEVEIKQLFECNLCLETFTEFEELRNHLVPCSNSRPDFVYCGLCSRGFKKKAYLVSHLRKVHKKEVVDKKYILKVRPSIDQPSTSGVQTKEKTDDQENVSTSTKVGTDTAAEPSTSNPRSKFVRYMDDNDSLEEELDYSSDTDESSDAPNGEKDIDNYDPGDLKDIIGESDEEQVKAGGDKAVNSVDDENVDDSPKVLEAEDNNDSCSDESESKGDAGNESVVSKSSTTGDMDQDKLIDNNDLYVGRTIRRPCRPEKPHTGKRKRTDDDEENIRPCKIQGSGEVDSAATNVKDYANLQVSVEDNGLRRVESISAERQESCDGRVSLECDASCDGQVSAERNESHDEPVLVDRGSSPVASIALQGIANEHGHEERICDLGPRMLGDIPEGYKRYRKISRLIVKYTENNEQKEKFEEEDVTWYEKM